MSAKMILFASIMGLGSSVALADTIVQNTGTPGFPGTFNSIGYNSSSVAFGQSVPSQFLEFGGRFHPNGADANATFVAGTTVTATQNGVTVNVPSGNSIPCLMPGLLTIQTCSVLGSSQSTIQTTRIVLRHSPHAQSTQVLAHLHL